MMAKHKLEAIKSSIIILTIIIFGGLIFGCSDNPPITPDNEPPTITLLEPADQSANWTVDPTLRWTGSDPDGDTIRYDVYFGNSMTPSLVSAGQLDTLYNPQTLNYDTKYYWKIVAKDIHADTSSSAIREFTTETQPNQPPTAPGSPDPPDNSLDQNTDITLSWTCSDPDGDPLEYDVCLGTSNNPPLVSSGQQAASYTPPTLQLNTVYYWKIIASDDHGNSTSSAIWKFTTKTELPVVTTADITVTSESGAQCGGTVESDGGADIIARGVCWSTSQTPTIQDNLTNNGTSLGDFTSQLTGLIKLTKYYVRAYATNSAGTGYGSVKSFTAGMGTVTDIDGNVYKTVIIGSQWWMAENLKVTQYRNGDDIPIKIYTWWGAAEGAYCEYNNIPANVSTYGRLYNWFAVDDPRGLAPVGWHVPSDAEWQTLVNYLGGDDLAGEKMKEAGIAHWEEPNYANNASGFSALPGGGRYPGTEAGTYDGMYWLADFWSSSDYLSANAWLRSLWNSSESIGRTSTLKTYGLSVRCVKD